MRSNKLVALLVVCAWTALVAGAAASAHRSRCDGHHAYRETATVLVYGKKGNVNGLPATFYWACRRPNGKAVEFAANGGVGYAPTYDLRQMILAGPYAGAVEITGEDSALNCSKYQPGPECPIPQAHISIVDVRGPKMVTITPPHQDSYTKVEGLKASSAGGVVWVVREQSSTALMAGVLHASATKLSLASQRLDTGQISHVTLRGLTVSWTNGATAHAAILR
jgi:hypothetical protein